MLGLAEARREGRCHQDQQEGQPSHGPRGENAVPPTAAEARLRHSILLAASLRKYTSGPHAHKRPPGQGGVRLADRVPDVTREPKARAACAGYGRAFLWSRPVRHALSLSSGGQRCGPSDATAARRPWWDNTAGQCVVRAVSRELARASARGRPVERFLPRPTGTRPPAHAAASDLRDGAQEAPGPKANSFLGRTPATLALDSRAIMPVTGGKTRREGVTCNGVEHRPAPARPAGASSPRCPRCPRCPRWSMRPCA